MSRIDPKNREEAFTYQFQDDVKMLKVASLHGEKEFEQVLQRIEATIGAYRNKRLRKNCEKAKKKKIEGIILANEKFGIKHSKKKSERFPFGCSSCLGEGCTNCR